VHFRNSNTARPRFVADFLCMPYWLDGNNLIGMPAARARADRDTRQQFLSLLSSCAQARGGRFVVYFDGDDPDGTRPPAGVRLRYSAPFSTDDAILREIEGCRVPSEVTVVTNDRSLGARCRGAGAKTMSWSEFTAKVGRARLRAGGGERDEQVDVADWIQYFGLNEDGVE
jgi:predicted RNA-binding protein with PIN domain